MRSARESAPSFSTTLAWWNFTVRRLRTLSLRIQANNVLNMVVWRTIDTNYNSPTFGHVVSAGQMRSVQIVLRAGF